MFCLWLYLSVFWLVVVCTMYVGLGIFILFVGLYLFSCDVCVYIYCGIFCFIVVFLVLYHFGCVFVIVCFFGELVCCMLLKVLIV